jgi:hypothetical protein
MKITILAMNPQAADGRGATAVEKLVEAGGRLHGTPVVWNGQLLQVVIQDEKGK